MDTQDASNKILDKTFGLLKEGETKIKFSKNKNLVLVLGNIGSGKSAFTQWIAGDNSKLISKEANEGVGDFIIEDGDRIGNETVFPGLVENANAAFYDCPGFDDTKSVSKDLAKAFFIKKMGDYSENLKFVFTVNHFSLRKGADQEDFLKLIRHAVELIRDVSKFKESISIIATKVDNQYIKKGERFVLVSDSVIKKAIVSFLKEIKNNLTEKSKASVASIMDKEFYKNAVQLIEALLMKNGEDYPKIGLFRRPDKAGPLTDIKLLQCEKKDAEKIVYENLKFTKKSDDDFRYTLSENSKNEINNLAKQIDSNVSTYTSDLSKQVQSFYQILIKNVKEKIDAFTKDKMVDKEVETFEAKDVSNKMNDGFVILSDTVKELNQLNSTKEFIDSVQKNFKKLGVNVSNETLTNIEHQGKYLDFLKLVSYKNFKISPTQFTTELQQTITYIFNSREEFRSSSTNLIEKVKSEIESEVEEIKTKLETYYRKRLENTEIQKLLKELNDLYQYALSVKVGDPNLINLKDFIKKVNNGFQNLDTSILINTLNIIKLEQSWQFLKILGNNDETDINSELFIMLFTSILNTTKYYKEWISFIDKIYKRLSEYDVQKDTAKCLKDLGLENENVNPKNLNQFLQKMNQQFGLKNDLESSSTKDLELQLLNNVLDLTLKSQVNFACQADKLIIKGDYVRFADLNKGINDCKKDNVQVFALNKLFIDDNLMRAGDKMKLMMIAPQMELVGDRTINLDGADAKPNSVEVFVDKGKPGFPGNSAGSLLAIGKEFINNGYLTVSANGGRATDGTNGSEGGKGASPNSDPYYYLGKYKCEDDCPNDEVFDGTQNFKCNKDPGCTGDSHCYHIHPKAGENGGDGGHFGIGGHQGTVAFVGFENDPIIRTLANKGADGQAGKGGLAGLDGDQVDILCKKGKAFFTSKYHNVVNRSASNGKDNANGEGLKQPEPAIEINNESITAFLSDYKVYLRENLDNRFKKSKLNQFYDYLETNNKVEDRYTTLSMVKELKALEEQYLNLNKLNKDDLIFIYKSFLERVSSFANNLNKDAKDLMENKKVLGYLYTTILSKLYNLETDLESGLIINVSDYLDLVNEDMAKLKDIKDEENKLNVIKKYKDDYKEKIDKKIEEAKELINKEVLPELDKINTEMDKKLDALIKEVLELEKKAQEDHDNLIKKKHELERQMAMHVGFGILKFFGAALGFLGPMGAFAGSVIGGASQVGEGIALGDQSGLPPLNLKDEDVKNLNGILERFKNKKIDELNKLVEVLLQDLQDYRKEHNDSNELKDVEEKILAIKEKIKTANGSQLNQLLKEIKQVLADKESELKDKRIFVADGSALKKVGEMLGKFKSIANLGYEVYNKYKNDKGQLAAINNAIQQNESIIARLREYENEIYETIVPMLHAMQGDLKKVSESLKNKSQVALDVTKWKTQMVLRDMKLEMHQLTQGFKVEANIARCIEKQEETMNTLVNIYDRIETYQDQQNLGNYMANICSASAKKINISNPDLAKSVSELEIAIRSNVVLKQYTSALSALKQWVFPFAQVYLKELKLPNQFKLENNLDNQVDEVKDQIEKIKRKIAIYKTSIQKSDEYIHNGEFSSDYKSTKPFYVFKNEDNLEMITRLLSGEEVLTNADILDSVAGKDAIKFNRLEINFKARNESLQSEIKNKLDLFKISATHLGNSYYRCDKKIYSITSPSQTIEYSLEKKEDGTPVDQNDVYRKISEGDLMLSPYAMWKLQLIKSSDSANFDELVKYKNEIDLELIGYGGYLIINASNLEIDDYYSHDDTVISKKKDESEETSLLGRFKSMTSNLLGKMFATRNNEPNHLNSAEINSYSDQNLVEYKTNDFESFEAPRLDSGHSQKTSMLSSANSPVDSLGNLILGQLIVGKVYGPNKHLSHNHYISPDLKRRMKINELSKRILPILKKQDEDF